MSLHKSAVLLVALLLLTAIISLGVAMNGGGTPGSSLPGWELKWSSAAVPDPAKALKGPEEEWTLQTGHSPGMKAPEGKSAAWVRISLPNIEDNSAVLIDKVYGNDIKGFVNNVLIYKSNGTASLHGSKVLIPLSKEQSGAQLFLWISGEDQPVGIKGGILTGSYGRLLSLYVKQDFMDIIIGASLIFTAGAFAVCAIFLKRELFVSGFFVVLIIVSSGVLVITYSPFVPFLQSSSGRFMDTFFDLALFTLLLSFAFLFEKMFGPGKKGIVTGMRRFLVGYTILCSCLWILNLGLSYRLDGLYEYMTVNVAVVLMILQFLLLLGQAVYYAYRGNADALIFSVGFAAFAMLMLAEMIMFYRSEGIHHFYWWKWGVVMIDISLIVILGRSFAGNHQQVVRYSHDLEKFNNDLQRSEKMGIISELAASVAHEVRNPLLITRGFLQILGERSGHKEKEYLQMAVMELDRASLIISDFLTFAKPEIEAADLLDVSGELTHVAGVLVPLANLQSSEIVLKLQNGLYVQGSSSKLKQAFINIIKNSVEAIQENGLITITLWRSGNHIIVSVRDNGEGMKSSELARLGEPYFSNKTKGTGLGLMVTFRIIEAMGGTIKFHSQKGEGTEVIVKLPAG
ncbi:HAMP domain-containing sensor histidine kinase [Paenibacillus sp. BR2-3]|uniref:ATP-binding protein n=1 Tax=Paenibacillus sp. BR2-3 TaxID=3048494 RepID=UPI003977C2DC